MSFITFFKNIEETIKKIQILQKNNITAELELRFGDFKKTFEPNVGKYNFEKIFNKFDNSTYQNEIIVDYIYNNDVKYKTLDKNKYNLRNNFIKKDIFLINKKNITTDFNIPEIEPQKTEYILKEKKSQYTKDNIRFSYNLENEIDIIMLSNYDLLHKNNKPFELIRLKNRYSRVLNDFLRLDLTIVKKINPKDNKMYDEIEYMIEAEIVNIHKDNLLEELKHYLHEINKVYFDINKFFSSIAPMNPQTMEKKDLNLLKKYKYSVTDKADGVRAFLFFDNKKIKLYNPKTNDSFIEFENNTNIFFTMIDGEYLKKDNRFFAFDLLFLKKKDIRGKNLSKRLEELKRLEDKIQEYFQDRPLLFKVKTFYFDNIFDKAKELWTKKNMLFDYQLDGLIFTPEESPYTSDLNTELKPTLKWKEDLTIDVRVEYNYRENFTYFHTSGKNIWKDTRINSRLLNDKNYTKLLDKEIKYSRWVSNKKQIINNINTYNIGKINNGKLFLGLYGIPTSHSNIKTIWSKYDIVEYIFDFNLNQWVALRIRTFDKEKPNAYKTIESIVNTIINYVSLQDIYEMKKKEVENVGNLYDLTKDNIPRKNWRFYNNYVKGKIYNEVNKYIAKQKHRHLNLASGKLGDLHKLLKAGYTDILAIDTSEEEIYGKNGAIARLLGAGFKKEDYKYTKNDITICVVLGDVTKNIKNCAMNEKEQDKLNKYFKENDNKFDSIAIMYAIHYLLGSVDDKDKIWKMDKNKLEGFLNNIKTYLKYGGLFFGVYLNGNNINEDKTFYHNNDKIYSIKQLYNENKEIKNYNQLIKQKEINTIEIQNEVWGKDLKISEPKINNQILDIMFDHIKMKSIKQNNTFQQYYDTFVEETKRELSQGEKELCFINNIFMYTCFNTEIFMIQINEKLKLNIYNKQDLLNYLHENILNDNLEKDIKQIYNLLINS